jgi:hypothetical protein
MQEAFKICSLYFFYDFLDFLPYMKYYKPKSSKRFSKNLFLYRQSVYRYNIHL